MDLEALTPPGEASGVAERLPDARAGGVTIYAVARLAGVSIATVSRALRGTGPVSPRTRDRVLKAVDDLRFTPSRLGVSLAERRHAANGIVFPDLSGPYYAEVVLGYEEVAARLGRSVLILSTRGRAAVDATALDLANRVDGLVVLGQTVDDAAVAEIAATGRPLVLLARPTVGIADTVNAENTESARLLGEHLLGHGYRRIAFLGDPGSSPDVAERWTGVRAALRAAGVRRPARPVPCAFDEEAGRLCALRLLSGDTRPEAVVCANDEIALGALLAAEQLGIRVPDDLAVTGWDDVMAARYARPALTTIRQPMRELGARAATALQARINGDTGPPRHDVLPTELVVRASCGHHSEEDKR